MCAEQAQTGTASGGEHSPSILMRSPDIRPAIDERDVRPWWQRIVDWLRVSEPKRLGSEPGPLLEPEPGRIGICCSGGGIRSAAYNLGALQTLEAHQVLGR